jgi:SAM-dependent methyltransferase
MKNLLEKMYEDHHTRNGKYGFAHHLTSKGQLFSLSVGIGKMVLDLGCRDGILTEQYCAANTVTCVDIDERALQLCRDRLRVEVIQHDLNYPLPFADHSFNVVVAADVLEHVFFGINFIREIRRVLVNDGVFLGSTPNAFYWTNRIRFALGTDPYEFLDTTHVRHFSLGSLSAMLSKEFDHQEIVPYGRHILAGLIPQWFAGDFFWRARSCRYLPSR